MKISNNTIGNRTRDLPTCSPVPQPTALPRAPLYLGVHVTIGALLSITWKNNCHEIYYFAASRYKWNTDIVEEDSNFVEG